MHKIKEGKRIFCLYNVPCKLRPVWKAPARVSVRKYSFYIYIYIFFFFFTFSKRESVITGKAYVQPASLVVRIVVSRVNTKLEVPYPSCLALGQSTFNIIFIFQAASNTTRKRNPFETTLNNVKFQIKLNRVPHFNLFCSWCYISVIVGRKLLMIIHQLINQIAQTTQVRIVNFIP